MNKKWAICGTVFGLLSVNAQAAIVTQTFDINASNFKKISGFPDTPPVDPAHLNFTVTFDNSVDVKPTNIGLVINSLNVSGQADYAYSSAQDRLYIGAFINPVSCDPSGSRPAYCAQISTKGVPTFGGFAQNTGVGIYDTETGSVTTSAGAVPEPATWALMISGFAMVGCVTRRRQTSVVA